MKYNSITTLNEIRAHAPCKDGWEKLLSSLGKTKADDEPLSLVTILESNGLDDALWCLRAKSLYRLSRHFQAWCADQVLHNFQSEWPSDTRVMDQIAMLRNDDATERDRAAARDAAWETTWAAAWDTAWETAWDTARDTAPDTAQAAAWETARAAAWDAQEKQLRSMLSS